MSSLKVSESLALHIRRVLSVDPSGQIIPVGYQGHICAITPLGRVPCALALLPLGCQALGKSLSVAGDVISVDGVAVTVVHQDPDAVQSQSYYSCSTTVEVNLHDQVHDGLWKNGEFTSDLFVPLNNQTNEPCPSNPPALSTDVLFCRVCTVPSVMEGAGAEIVISPSDSNCDAHFRVVVVPATSFKEYTFPLLANQFTAQAGVLKRLMKGTPPDSGFVDFTVCSVGDGLVSCPIVCPRGVSTEDNQKYRRGVHEIFCLPLRKLIHEASNKGYRSVKLNYALHSNVHDTIPKTSATGGELYLVREKYDYYHYKVEGFDDNGWGCAYRSLQTLLSWYAYQGHVDRMPSLKDIQAILKEVDPDKQKKPNFVGSKDWIGSFEVMMVLQHLIPSLECTLQHVEKGSDLGENPTVMRVLQAHFKSVGSPVMIGGHNYAHTILGIDYNPSLAKIRYLILDPHYPSSSSDVKFALEKGYCGWKDPSFFNATHFYNLCLPRVPKDL